MELELLLTELQPFELSHLRQLYALKVILGNSLHCKVWSLCNQLFLQFSMDHFEIMHTCCGYIEDVHVNFYSSKNNF